MPSCIRGSCGRGPSECRSCYEAGQTGWEAEAAYQGPSFTREAVFEAELTRIKAALRKMRTTYAQNRHAQEWASFIEGFKTNG
jgi:hypothetical protein